MNKEIDNKVLTKNNDYSSKLASQIKKEIKISNNFIKKNLEREIKKNIKDFLKNEKIKPLNLSLFSDYNPKTTTYGLGFKDKEKALYTVKAIKNRDLKYQVNVIATMLGRAKKHPYKTKNKKDAIKVFSLWIKNYKKKG